MPAGRPSVYSPELAREICERIALDESLKRICEDDHMPDRTTVFRWKNENPEFRDLYARAREEQGHTAADQLSDIRREMHEGTLDHQVGTAIARVAQWEAARRAVKAYGDRQLIGSDPANPLPSAKLDVSGLSTEALAELARAGVKG